MTVSSHIKRDEYSLYDSGSYGCVVRPVITNGILKEYVPYTSKNSSDIAKIFMNGKADFLKELKYFKKMKTIDPLGNFTIKMKGANVFDSDTLNRSPSVEYCLTNKYKKEKFKKYYQIIQEFGGNEIKDDRYKISYIECIKLLKKFLTGFRLFQKANLVHSDIKYNNLLISKRKISLIDFGMITTVKQLYSSILNHRTYLSTQWYNPPESSIAYYIAFCQKKENPPPLSDIIIKSWYVLLQNNYFEKKTKIDKIETFKKMYNETKEFIMEITKKKYKSYKSIYTKEIALKYDIYQLSFVFSELQNHVIFTNKSQIEFLDEFIGKCYHSNPFERFNINQLIQMIDIEHKKISKNRFRQMHMSLH